MELLSCQSSFFVVGLQPEFFSICMTTENCQSIELHFHTVRLDSKYRIHGPILKSEMHIMSLQVIKALLVLDLTTHGSMEPSYLRTFFYVNDKYYVVDDD